jgi:formylglycine-generating enzyme required for sulfatase activity
VTSTVLWTLWNNNTCSFNIPVTEHSGRNILLKMKKVERNSYFEIPQGLYPVGMTDDEIRSILADRSFTGPAINSTYLYNSYPRHDVELQSCHVSKKLTVYDDFKAFIAETGYRTEAERDGWGWVWGNQWEKKRDVSWNAPFMNDDDILYREYGALVPVLQVSCNDAEEYCRYKSNITGEKVRLPSEWEWEAMVQLYEIKLRDMQGLQSDSRVENKSFMHVLIDIAHENRSFHPTGLVWEWTINWFRQYPGGPANTEFGETYKVLRGGSLMSMPVQKNPAYRFRRCPTARSPYYGFRTCLENND